MCGIVGLLGGLASASGDLPRETIMQMTARLRHRGPDSGGHWLDEDAGIALGHRRLSIIDLSEQGHQPMLSSTGRFVTVYNGEVYNYRELREELTHHNVVFRGGSDTEVVLAAIERWGFPAALQRLVGMFALAVWDRQRRELLVARDRLGKKPLYLGYCNGTLAFASELKAIANHPQFDCDIDRRALALLMRYGYVPDPHCIYAGWMKLPPGSLLVLSAEDLETRSIDRLLGRCTRYWSLESVVQAGASKRHGAVSQAAAIEEAESLLRDAVRQRMISDVPLGAFLSGGVDSSLVVALMRASSAGAVRTFTIGFHEKEYDEAVEARLIANHLQTDHTEFYCSSEDARALIPRLAFTFDEPFADSSQLPSLLLSSLARTQVRVALSGDGGDESFGGYDRYAMTARLQPVYRVPRMIRRLLSSGLTLPSAHAWDGGAKLIGGLVPEGLSGDRIHKMAHMLVLPTAYDFYTAMMSQWTDQAGVVLGGDQETTSISGIDRFDDSNETIWERMMYRDTIQYLPGDILVKMDRASMAYGLEVRCPLLDHRLVEFAWQLPLELKTRAGDGKWILRQILSKYVPQSLFERPKHGFRVPVGSWLRGPLRPWAEALLDPDRLEREGFFRSAPVRQRWSEHMEGARNWSASLWHVLMFQAWLEQWRNGRER